MLKSSRPHWPRGIRLSLMLVLCGATLLGCASAVRPSPATSSPCPEPTPVPATVSSSDSGNAKAYLQKVQDFSGRVSTWLEKVRDYTQERAQTKTP